MATESDIWPGDAYDLLTDQIKELKYQAEDLLKLAKREHLRAMEGIDLTKNSLEREKSATRSAEFKLNLAEKLLKERDEL